MALDNDLNSLHELREKKLYSAELVRTPGLAQKLALWCGGIFLIIVFSTFLPWTQNIRSNGILTSLDPEDRPQTIHSTIAGRIEKWHVYEGQNVKKGDTILHISEIKEKYFDPSLINRIQEQLKAKEGVLKSSKEKVEAQKKQIVALQSGLDFSLKKARNKVLQIQLKLQSDSMDFIAAQTSYQIAKVQMERQEKLYEQGLKSLTELEQRRLKFQEESAKIISYENKVNSSRNELLNSQIELNSLQAEYVDKISKAQSELSSTYSYLFNTEGEISKMNNELSSVTIRNSFYYITAPQDGIIVKALRQGIGETIKEGEPIASIMPSQPQLAAELYVKPMDLPLLQIGRKVRLQFDGWPTLVFSGWPGVSFGTFGGEVAVIDNIDTQGTYRILVTPDDEWPEQLRVGSGVYGWAMLNDVPIYYEIWRQLNGFPPDYFQNTVPVPGNVEKKKNDSN